MRHPRIVRNAHPTCFHALCLALSLFLVSLGDRVSFASNMGFTLVKPLKGPFITSGVQIARIEAFAGTTTTHTCATQNVNFDLILGKAVRVTKTTQGNVVGIIPPQEWSALDIMGSDNA